MSEQERINLYERLGEAMERSTKAMLDRKAKLGETVVIADANGRPIEIAASEAMKLYIKQLTDE